MELALEEKRAVGWSQLIEALYQDDWRGDIRRNRSSFAFRGMVCANWPISTSLMRLGGPFKGLEKHLLRNFRKYAHRDVVERDSLWHWLTMGQHHGLPTRLLDWTYSPLVAMHFATDDLTKMDQDGVIWMVNIPDAHRKLPSGLQSALLREGSYVFTVEMLDKYYRTKQMPYSIDSASGSSLVSLDVGDLDKFDEEEAEAFAVFLEPASIDDRIVNQFGLFSALSDSGQGFDDWLRKNDVEGYKVVIPADSKWEVRDRLDQANITERVIYPGLDGLSRWLKRHYCPRP